jgi:hypothetical protein
MLKTSVKQLTVPENVYDEMKKLVDQASVKLDILQLLTHHHIDRTAQSTLLKGILSDISKYRGSSLLTMKGLIITLLMTKYELTSVEAFHVIESLIS